MTMREAYIEKLQAKMNEMDAQIEVLQANAADAKAEAKIELEKQVLELKDTQATVQEKVDELREAGDDAWTEMKVSVEHAWLDFENATKKLASRLAA